MLNVSSVVTSNITSPVRKANKLSSVQLLTIEYSSP